MILLVTSTGNCIHALFMWQFLQLQYVYRMTFLLVSCQSLTCVPLCLLALNVGPRLIRCESGVINNPLVLCKHAIMLKLRKPWISFTGFQRQNVTYVCAHFKLDASSRFQNVGSGIRLQ